MRDEVLKILIITPWVTPFIKSFFKKLLVNYDIHITQCNSAKGFPHKVLATQTFDLIITFDLVGFEQTTLMDGISYNLVNSKFVNFLLHENLQNEKYLSKQLSLSMFFYCVGSQYETYLRKKYPDIPYLRSLDETAGSIEAAMKRAVDEVILECRLW